MFENILLETGQRSMTVTLVNHVIVGQREYRLDIGNLVGLDIIPIGIAQEEQLTLRVVDNVNNVVGIEVLQNGNNRSTIGDRSQIRNHPTGVVTANQCDAIALLNVGLLQQKVQFSDLLGHLIVRECFILEIVGQRRQLAIVAETLLVEFNQVFLQHSLLL